MLYMAIKMINKIFWFKHDNVVHEGYNTWMNK